QCAPEQVPPVTFHRDCARRQLAHWQAGWPAQSAQLQPSLSGSQRPVLSQFAGSEQGGSGLHALQTQSETAPFSSQHVGRQPKQVQSTGWDPEQNKAASSPMPPGEPPEPALEATEDEPPEPALGPPLVVVLDDDEESFELFDGPEPFGPEPPLPPC